MPLLGSRRAAQFHAALVSDVIRKVNALEGRAARYFFLSGREFPSSLSGYARVRQRGPDLGARLERAFRLLLRLHSVAIVLGTDSPALCPRHLLTALGELRFSDSVLGPSPDGGYYLIGLRRLVRGRLRGLFRGVRWGSAFAFRDTLRNLLRRGLVCSVLEPCADIDRPEDFQRLESELRRSPKARRASPAVWEFTRECRRVRVAPGDRERAASRMEK